MRNRELTNAHDAQLHFRIDITFGGAHDDVDIPHVVSQKDSFMTDDLSRYAHLRPDNPCAHAKRLVVASSGWPNFSDPWYYPATFVSVSGAPNWFELTRFTDPGAPNVSEDYARFLKNAAHFFQQQFRAKASLANFLYELKDFKRMAESFARSVGGGLLSTLRRFAGAEARDRINTGVGGNYLDYVFNWKPLVQDTGKLLNAYQLAMKRLEFLVHHSTYVDHRRIRFKIDPGERGFEPFLYFDLRAFTNLAGFTYECWLMPVDCQVTFNASAVIDNKLALGAINAWWAVADQLGLNNLPMVLWNATKLSWLVDFFIDSKDFFEAFEVQAYQGYLAIQRGMCSRKVVREYNIIVKFGGADSGDLKQIQVGVVRYTDYARDYLRTIQPGFFSLAPSLDADQTAILGALADSNVGTGHFNLDWFQRVFRKNRGTFGRSGWKRPKSR